MNKTADYLTENLIKQNYLLTSGPSNEYLTKYMDKFLTLFIVILMYVILLFILRYLNIGRKKKCNKCNNCCPDCNFSLNRVKRITRDDIINNMTFRIFDSKRYICSECGWEGLKWEDDYTVKKN